MIQSSKSLTIEQWVATDKYRDNYDRIFGKKPTILSWEDDPVIVIDSAEKTPSPPEAQADVDR
jgi:hypothetical protein